MPPAPKGRDPIAKYISNPDVAPFSIIIGDWHASEVRCRAQAWGSNQTHYDLIRAPFVGVKCVDPATRIVTNTDLVPCAVTNTDLVARAVTNIDPVPRAVTNTDLVPRAVADIDLVPRAVTKTDLVPRAVAKKDPLARLVTNAKWSLASQ